MHVELSGTANAQQTYWSWYGLNRGDLSHYGDVKLR